MRNGEAVAAFERAFAEYVGARYAIALCNGTATLHTALVALGVKPGDRVAVPPLTMSATTIAVLHAGAVPVFCDVDPATWLMATAPLEDMVAMPVSLYGLHVGLLGGIVVDDAAQTLRPRNPFASFTSYSFQASKILALGEGGMLVTNDEALATRAREFSSLGYRMRADQPRIDPAVLKSPTYARHHALGWNYRMNDVTAAEGLRALECGRTDHCVHVRNALRQTAAGYYRAAVAGCPWLTPQHVPAGRTHDYWTFAVACDTPERAARLADLVVTFGGERPYAAWRLTYHEPAFAHLEVHGRSERPRPETGGALCPVAESLQPRLLQFQTNGLGAADQNALALRRAIFHLGGSSVDG